jgi:hypothetical protein
MTVSKRFHTPMVSYPRSKMNPLSIPRHIHSHAHHKHVPSLNPRSIMRSDANKQTNKARANTDHEEHLKPSDA